MPTDLTPCLFLDRDGIVNEEPVNGERYITHPDKFHLIPAAVEAVRIARSRGYRCVVVTNQKGLHTGVLSEALLQAIHHRMSDELLKQGQVLDGIYYCPHGDGMCDCRKPLPGMLLQAAREHAIDLARSWMVGDNPRDCEAGKRAGCFRSVLVREGAHSPFADAVLASMDALPTLLDAQLPQT